MHGDELRQHFLDILPAQLLIQLAQRYGLVERQRQLDVVQLVLALVLCGGTHEGGRQYDVLRRYLEGDAPTVVRGAFYAWFDHPLENLMTELLKRAMALGQKQRKLLPGILRGVSDWRIFDSTTIKLPDQALAEYPGTGDYAAIKVHKEFSVGVGNLVGYEFSPARDHDSPFLKVDESRRGTGLLFDLAYVSLARIAACEEHDVRFVARLKDNWKPRVRRLVRGAITSDVVQRSDEGEDFDVLLDQDLIVRDGRAIDADVVVGRRGESVKCRLVGVHTPKGYCFFLTNLPRRTHGPNQVGDLYRIRWEIETDNKVDKAGARLDEISARKGVSIRILLLASLLNTTIARTIVQSEKLAARSGRKPDEPASCPPLHPILVVRALATMHSTVTQLLLSEEERLDDWSRLMAKVRHLGHDPNWRRRPSVLDRVQGLSAPPGRRRASKASGSVSN